TLLPYIEQDNLFKVATTVAPGPANTWDPAAPSGVTVRQTLVKTYQCTSDITMTGQGWSAGQVNVWMGSSYAANLQMLGTAHQPSPKSVAQGGGAMACDILPQIKPTQQLCQSNAAQGNHTGQVMCLLMDGSVRGVTTGITQTTWNNALLPDDGNALGSDW